ncbi:hypothetical protein E0485_15465 [Paenibacillus albiflavus]|uniref:LppX_LprAFG lipoprotein n=1 Tax=Paenibacillus albiflavus TaxID=2545760 RepID=A0A4R4E8A6_9BACL|nr:DUF6612 family protein [Paenibacillus albiflavus]TCZ75779.1 hypothetical protein E0485_15465 [Paenibacillus albiflavus]
MQFSNKIVKIWTAIVLVGALVLSGCSAEQLKAAEVYKKTQEASQKLDSFGMDMDMKMNMAAGTDKMDMNTAVNASIIMKPDLQMDMLMDLNMAGQQVKMQMVLVKDGLFVKDPSNAWTQMPKEQVDLMMGSSKEQYDPSAQLDQLKQFADDFSMTESSEAYTLKLEATGEKFKKFMQEEMKKQLASQQNMGALAENMPEFTFNKAEYVFVIDKKTFNPKEVNMVLDAEFTVEGQKVQMNIDMKATYNKFNEIKEIKLPEGAK